MLTKTNLPLQLLFVFGVLFLSSIEICIAVTETYLTEQYHVSNILNSGLLDLNNGIIKNMVWGIDGSFEGLVFKSFDGSDQRYGSNIVTTNCQTVALIENEVINRVDTHYGGCSPSCNENGNYVRGIVFYTNFGNEFSCMVSGKVTDHHATFDASLELDQSAYLSGFKIRSGSIIDSIAYQFTWKTEERTCNDNEFKVSIRSCNGFKHLINAENTLNIKLQFTEYQTKYLEVSANGDFPNNGQTKSYCVGNADSIDLSSDTIGDLVSVSLENINTNLLCLSELSINNFDLTINETFGINHFGNGIILSNECKYSFNYIFENEPLIKCFDNIFEINTEQERTIYDITLHTCLHPSSSVTSEALRNDLTFNLMGELLNETEWINGEIMRLDHFAPLVQDSLESTSSHSANRIGSLVMSNYVINRNGGFIDIGNDFYPIFDGTVIGIRLIIKSAQFELNFNYLKDIQIIDSNVVAKTSFDSNIRKIILKYETTNKEILFQRFYCLNFNLFNNECSDLLLFGVTEEVTVSRNERTRLFFETEISVVSSIPPIITDVLFIYKNYNKKYQLPYYLLPLDSQTTDTTFFAANDACQQSEYKSDLASFHDDYTFAMMQLLCPVDSQCWIGASQLSLSGRDDGVWKWLDGSGYFTDVELSDFFATINTREALEFSQDVLYMNGDGLLNDETVSKTNINYALCNNNDWLSDTTKIFEFNMNTVFDLLVLLSIHNSGNDAICIDSISAQRVNNDISDIQSTQLIKPSNWIGNSGDIDSICDTKDCSTSGYGFFALPICHINIIDISIESIEQNEDTLDGDLITGKCKNGNRYGTTQCSISQTIEVSETTEFSMSHARTNGRENSITQGRDTTQTRGSESSFSVGGSSTFGWSSSVSVAVETEVKIPFIGGSKVTATATGGLSGSTESNFQNSGSTTNENSQTLSMEKSTSITNEETKEQSQTFGITTTKAVNCEASVDIPPNHSIDYLLSVDQSIITINTRETLELILCSSYLSSSNVNDNSINPETLDVIYVENVPGSIKAVEASICNIEFTDLKAVPSNTMACDESKVLAISSGEPYLPMCNENDSSLYDGCQCQIGDTELLAPCYCVDSVTGNILHDGKGIFVEDGSDWRDSCIELACQNSIF